MRGWCPNCQAEVNLIALDDATLSELCAAAHIQEWIAKDKVHAWQPANGSARICLPSLLACFESAEAERVFRSIEKQFDEIRREK